MNDLNKVTISGRLTRDPEVKFTPSGTAICNLSVAVNKSWKDKNTGEKREQTSFVDVGLFQGQAEFAGKFCFKGQRIIVSGELKQEQWEDKNTGQKRSRLSINSNEIIPIDWPERDGEQSQPQQQRPQGNPAPHTAVSQSGAPSSDDDVPW
jgi:single-strand DNA-binding protein